MECKPSDPDASLGSPLPAEATQEKKNTLIGRDNRCQTILETLTNKARNGIAVIDSAALQQIIGFNDPRPLGRHLGHLVADTLIMRSKCGNAYKLLR